MDQKEIDFERVLIVGLELSVDTTPLENSLDELEELVEAAGGVVVGRVSQRAKNINATYFIGRGKALEIKDYAKELDASTIIFNDELSGAQLRNLEELIDRKIVDRTNLILDIFANRARTREGKLQVKLAQMQYRLPRLVGFRDYLSREGGGIGTRGPGEQKLETDRRHILREINNIKSELKKVEKNRSLKRKKRENSNIPIVALVGYTNAGKSTLLNALMNKSQESDESKEVFVKDMLFATLDTSLRRSNLPNGQAFLITDTVGFVSKLPTRLVEAFKSTLEEVRYADLLLHVVDASNEDIDIQIKTTFEILKDLDVLSKPIITVFNKMDKVELEDIYYDESLIDRKLFISAYKDEDLDKLLESIEASLPQEFRRVRLSLPYGEQAIVDYFLSNYQVENMEYTDKGTVLDVSINHVDFNKYNNYIV